MNQAVNIKRWHLVIAVITMAFMIGTNIIGIVVYAKNLEAQIKETKSVVSKHITDTNIHMPLEKRLQLFVLRGEYSGQVQDIKDDLKEIKSDIKKILSKSSLK